MNINVSTKKLLMNILNFDFGLYHLVAVILLSWYCSMKSLSIIGTCINLELTWKESKEMGIDCLSLVQFLLIGVVIVSFSCSRWSTKAKFTVKYISKSGFSCSPHAANDSNKKLLSTSMSQLHKMEYSLVCYYYKWILFFYSWANLQELFAFLHLIQMVLHQTCCGNSKNHNFL